MATTNRFEHEHDYAIYFDHIISVGPKILHRYITFITAITGVNIKTASNYYRDLILLFKYVALRRGFDLDFSQFTPEDYDKVVTLLEPVVTEDFVCSVTRDEIIEFLFHLKNENDNTAHGRNRRLSAIKGFYNYLCADLNLIEANPTSNLKTARSEKKLPIFLTLEESKLLLNSVPYNANYFRNFCILTLFLNLGLRINELVNINLQDIRGNRLLVMGKGSKERYLYLTPSCLSALADYKKVRISQYKIQTKFRDALFISRAGRRVSYKTVYTIVADSVKAAGLDNKKYSPHKLRHTAATLMHQNGVDINSLKDVLGHESIATTEIYAHTNLDMVKAATNKNPLSGKLKEDIN